MVYTDIVLLAFILSILLDLFVTKSRLVTRAVFWTSYSIILPFQLITNWWLTSRDIVMYSPNAITGIRIASAPAEDLFFGFALVLSVMSLWIFWGKKGVGKK